MIESEDKFSSAGDNSIIEINAKSILRKHKKIDSWFISLYWMNLNRGCIHNCVYCDGRSERYYVDGGEKFRKKNNFDFQEIFSMIDSMPMRQREMRENRKDEQ